MHSPALNNDEDTYELSVTSEPTVGGFRNPPKMSEIQIRTFETPWEVSIFQKCLNYKLLSDPILKKNINSLNLPILNANLPK